MANIYHFLIFKGIFTVSAVKGKFEANYFTAQIYAKSEVKNKLDESVDGGCVITESSARNKIKRQERLPVENFFGHKEKALRIKRDKLVRYMCLQNGFGDKLIGSSDCRRWVSQNSSEFPLFSLGYLVASHE